MTRFSSSPPPPSRRGPTALSGCAAFSGLAEKAARLDALDRALRQTLPAPLRAQARYADRRGDRLVFLASSPASASRLRLLQVQILATAAALGEPAAGILVKVAPASSPPPTPALAKPLSRQAAKHLRAAAAGMADVELREMFLKLAALAP